MPKAICYFLSFGLLSIAPPRVDSYSQPDKSIVITQATVYDGSGGPSFRANVRIEGDRIAEIGSFRNLVLAPGFKDRRMIRKGMKADLVFFNPRTIIDRSNFLEGPSADGPFLFLYLID